MSAFFQSELTGITTPHHVLCALLSGLHHDTGNDDDYVMGMSGAGLRFFSRKKGEKKCFLFNAAHITVKAPN